MTEYKTAEQLVAEVDGRMAAAERIVQEGLGRSLTPEEQIKLASNPDLQVNEGAQCKCHTSYCGCHAMTTARDAANHIVEEIHNAG